MVAVLFEIKYLKNGSR